MLILEIGCDQAAALASMASDEQKYGGIRIVRDLAGLDRVAVLSVL